MNRYHYNHIKSDIILTSYYEINTGSFVCCMRYDPKTGIVQRGNNLTPFIKDNLIKKFNNFEDAEKEVFGLYGIIEVIDSWNEPYNSNGKYKVHEYRSKIISGFTDISLNYITDNGEFLLNIYRSIICIEDPVNINTEIIYITTNNNENNIIKLNSNKTLEEVKEIMFDLIGIDVIKCY